MLHLKECPNTTELTCRNFSLRLDTINETDRSIEAVIATEAPVKVLDFSTWRIIEEILVMRGCRIPPSGQVPLLDSHDRSTVQKQYGSTRELRIETDKLVGRNYYSTSPAAEHAWRLAKEKHQTDNSIGYSVIRSVLIEPGDEAQVEGKNYKASPNLALRISLEWEVKENSVCPIGADAAAKTRGKPAMDFKENQMDEFKEWLKKRSLVYDDLADQKREELKAEFDAEKRGAKPPEQEKRADQVAGNGTPPPPPAADEKGIRKAADEAADEAIASERTRIAEITAVAGSDMPADVVQRAIADGTKVDDFRRVVLENIRKSRPKVTGPGIICSQMVETRQVLIDAMLLRAGYEDVVTKDKVEGPKRAEQANKYRDVNLLDLCRFAIRMEGIESPIGREDTIRMAFSTASLPQILGAVANKSMLRGYMAVPATWRKWCSVGQLPDFKTATRVRLTDTGALLEVGAGGEVKHGGAEEEYEQYHIKTYAKLFAVTRTQIINDDLQAFTRTPERLGRAAAELPSDLVYTHLLANGNMQDGVALFHATHINLNTTAGLAKDKLEAAVAAFKKQTDKAGRQISITPRILLVPVEKEWTAAELVKSTTIIIAGTTDSVRGSYNALADLNLEVVAEARMSNSSYTGYSATTWYLTASPAEADTIEVGFLNGIQTPTIEQLPTPAEVLGVQYRVFFDVGCKALDHRAMQKNTA